MVNKLLDHYECPIDVHLYKLINTHLHKYYNNGFTPNIVTTFSLLSGLISAQQILSGHFKTASLMLLISYYLDCVDGKLARQYNMITKFGDYYDHVGDVVKIIAILSALFISNKKKTSQKQWIYIGLMVVLVILQCAHLGYQEAIYDKMEESVFLNIWRKMVAMDNTPEKTIQYTKYFGCGTWYLSFALLIIFWRK